MPCGTVPYCRYGILVMNWIILVKESMLESMLEILLDYVPKEVSREIQNKVISTVPYCVSRGITNKTRNFK